jgi:hypothetical protein
LSPQETSKEKKFLGQISVNDDEKYYGRKIKRISEEMNLSPIYKRSLKVVWSCNFIDETVWVS